MILIEVEYVQAWWGMGRRVIHAEIGIANITSGKYLLQCKWGDLRLKMLEWITWRFRNISQHLEYN